MKLKTLMAWIVFSTSATGAVDEVYCDNVVVVLDASGSMSEPFHGAQHCKMDAAKAAMRQVLQTVPASTHVGVLVFSARNFTQDWLFPLGPRDDARLIVAVNGLQPGNDTPLGRYMKIGADVLLRQREKQLGYGSYRLLIVTDGEADDQFLVERYTPEINARNICIDVIGVNMRHNHPLATKVHAYRRADDAAALSSAMHESFAEVAGRGTDAAGADEFALLAALPSEAALPLLEALNSPGDQPIGEKPVHPLVSVKRDLPAAASPATPTPRAMPTTPAAGADSWSVWLFIGAVVALNLWELTKWLKKPGQKT
jgi:hypothetical protein